MAVKFVQTGASLDYTPDADVASGAVVVQGDLVGVAKLDIKANTLGALAIEGVFDFPKATGEATAITAGTTLYWDEADAEAKADAEAGANKLIGKSVKAAGDDDATVRVRMSQ